MKKFSLVLLTFLLLFSSVPVLSAQEAISQVQEVDSPSSEALAHPNSQNISWVAQKFGVFGSWIHNELAKGYTLTHIYEGLLEKQQGRSYEAFMQSLYPHTENGNPIVRSRTKRAVPLVIPVVIGARIAAPVVGRALVSAAIVVQEIVSGPVGKPNRKTQGREINTKQRSDSKWKSRSNKDSNRSMKKHTPSPKHKGGKKKK